MAGAVAAAGPLTQDIELSAWGLGVSGLRAYGFFRLRDALGSELVWPRSGDHFDALSAFIELERARWRVRAGRQQRASALGFYAFDGGTATWRPQPTVRLEAYGGRGLARGTLEPFGSLASLDPVRRDEGTWLVGGSVWAAPRDGAALTALYQREVLQDGSGLVTERAAADLQWPLGRHVLLVGAADGDIAAAAWGRARAAALVRLPRRGFVEVELFRYRPVLDFTTIWGAFNPEAHRGVAAAARVAIGPAVALTGALRARRYRPITEITPFLADAGRASTQAEAGVSWRGYNLAIDAGYRLTTGFGGAQSGGDVRVAFDRGGPWRAGLRAVAFQEEQAFRVADGTVYGLGADIRGALGRRLTLRADAVRYWHRRQQGSAGLDWSQTRGSVGLEWTVGASADRVGGAR